MTRNPLLYRWAAVAGLLGAVAACGGSPSSDRGTTPSPTPPSIAPDRFTAVPTLELPELELRADEPLDVAFERVNQAFRVRNLEPFDARRAYATSAARDFAWYLTINDPNDAFGRTQHVIFVVTGPWTPENTRAFLLSYLVMPGAPVGDVGRPWFTFYSVSPPPYGVRYLFGNSALGALEAAMLSEVGVIEWSAARAPEIATAVRNLLERLELASRSELAAACPPALDRLFHDLGRPNPHEVEGVFGRDYLPEATLAGLGLLVGESVRTELTGAAVWEADDDRIYPRLHVHEVAEGILRPIPMMIEFYLSDAELAPSDYCLRVLANLQVAPSGGEE